MISVDSQFFEKFGLNFDKNVIKFFNQPSRCFTGSIGNIDNSFPYC